MPSARLSRATLLVFAAVLAASLSGCVGKTNTISLPGAQLAGPRLLVIAPHPDDETAGTGGAIATARQHGWHVTVVFVTCGDGFWAAVRRRGGAMPTASQMQAYGVSRAAEARRAADALGIPPSDVVFLGFPDGSTHFLWNTSFDGPAVLGMNGARKVPYAFAYRPKASYTGAELQSELEQIIRRTDPTTVLMPDSADVHRDHWATGAFTQAALLRTGYAGLELTYLVHRAGFPGRSSDASAQPIEPPVSVRAADTEWLSLVVDDEARAAQAAAMATYRTQLRSDGPLLRAFKRGTALVGMARVPSLYGAGNLTLHEGGQDPSYRGKSPAGTISDIQVTREGTTAVVTLRTAAAASHSVTYLLHVRTYDGNGRMRFYDAQMGGGKFSALHTANESVSGKGGLVRFSGNAVAVRLPPELLTGARWLFVGADTYRQGLTADHAPWRLVRVAPVQAGSSAGVPKRKTT